MNQNFNELMKQAQAMQDQMQKAGEEIKHIKVVGKAGGVHGLEVTVDGSKNIVAIKVPKELEGETEMVVDLIIAASHDANNKIEEASRKKINELTKGMGISPDILKNFNTDTGADGG